MAGLGESLVLSSSFLGGQKAFGAHKSASAASKTSRHVRVIRARESSNGKATYSGDETDSRPKASRMVPIEEAVKRNGSSRSRQDAGASAASRNGYRKAPAYENSTSNGSAYRDSKGSAYRDSNGSANRDSNGSAYRVSSGSSRSYQNSEQGSSNGNTRTTWNGRGTGNGTIGSNGGNLAQSNINGAVLPNTSYVSKIVVRAPVELPPVEESSRVIPSDEAFSWSRDNYSPLQRNIDVWSFVLALRVRVYFLDAKWTYIGGFNEEKQSARRRKTASWVRETILQLGPTFIKLGQLSSTRSDLFPIEFVEELAKLQDKVPAFSAKKAKAFIERELGAPVNEIFAQFEEQPIAAASLGQVHRAVLFNGEKVAVKIQRPGLKALFDIDLNNMKTVAEYFQKSESFGGPTRDWIGIYEECRTILYQEIDYINEGRNADRFRSDFRKYPWARIPKIHWDYVSRQVLTLEYVPGIKINNVAMLDSGGFDRAQLASYAIEAYLIQILKTGFFHADPHPGNLAVDVDGGLIYYDFGMMGEIKAFTRERLLEMFYAVYEKDAQKVINALVDLGALVPTGDISPVRKTVQFFLDNLMNQRPDQASTFSAIGEDLFAIAIDQPFRFPATFTFVLRAFSTLEGIGTILNPDFSFAKIAAPYAQELLDIRETQTSGQSMVLALQRQAADVRDAAVAMPARIQRMDDIIRKLEAGDFRLRVRVLEAERAARRSSIQQSSTINLVAAACLVNIGVQLTLAQGISPISVSPFIGAGAFIISVLYSFRRISKLDKFEKML